MGKKFKAPPVSNSVSISIEAPEGFSVDGDTDIKKEPPKDQSKKLDLTFVLSNLYEYLESLEVQRQALDKQKQITLNLIDVIRKENGGCGTCGKKKT